MRHRFPPGVRFAPVASRPASPPSRQTGARAGDGRTPCPTCVVHEGSLLRRLTEGRCAPAAVCSGSFLPPNACGGQKWPVVPSGSGFAAPVFVPLPSPAGIRGKKEKGVLRFRGGFRWSPGSRAGRQDLLESHRRRVPDEERGGPQRHPHEPPRVGEDDPPRPRREGRPGRGGCSRRGLRPRANRRVANGGKGQKQ